jgi:hypothetical protein
MSPDLILGTVFGTGGSGVLGLILAALTTRRKSRLDANETLHGRYDAENKRANQRAEEAEEDAARYRKERDEADELRRRAQFDAARWERRAIALGWSDTQPTREDGGST